MFSGEKYANFRQICFDLRLQRNIIQGDCLGWYNEEGVLLNSRVCWHEPGGSVIWPIKVWLPRLDQIYEMLEPVCPNILLWRKPRDKIWCAEAGLVQSWAKGEGKTREEAALNLWIKLDDTLL